MFKKRDERKRPCSRSTRGSGRKTMLLFEHIEKRFIFNPTKKPRFTPAPVQFTRSIRDTFVRKLSKKEVFSNCISGVHFLSLLLLFLQISQSSFLPSLDSYISLGIPSERARLNSTAISQPPSESNPDFGAVALFSVGVFCCRKQHLAKCTYSFFSFRNKTCEQKKALNYLVGLPAFVVQR